MANSIKLVAKKYFPQATKATDKFPAQKLTLDSLKDIRRIKHRWEIIDEENNQIKDAKNNKTYVSETFTNGDTINKNRLHTKTTKKAEILFGKYPDTKKAYAIYQKLRNLFNNKK